MRVSPLALLGVVLVACSSNVQTNATGCLVNCERPTCVPFGVSTEGFGTGSDPVLVAGNSTTLELVAPLRMTCSATPADLHVDLLVTDPAGTQRASRVNLSPADGTGSFHASAVVATDLPGEWFVDATFEPSLGRSQGVVWAVKDGALATRLTERLPYPTSDCLYPSRTQSGTVLCQVSLPTPHIDVIRAGAVLSSFAGSNLAVVRDVVWTHTTDAMGIERRHDTGHGALALDGTVSVVRPFDLADYTSEFAAIRTTSESREAYVWENGLLHATTPVPFTNDQTFIQDGLVVGARDAVCLNRRPCPEFFASFGSVRLTGLDDTNIWLATFKGVFHVDRATPEHALTNVRAPKAWSAPPLQAVALVEGQPPWFLPDHPVAGVASTAPHTLADGGIEWIGFGAAPLGGGSFGFVFAGARPDQLDFVTLEGP